MGVTDIRLDAVPQGEFAARVSQHIQGEKQKAESANAVASKIVQPLIQPVKFKVESASRDSFNQQVFSGKGFSPVGTNVDVKG